jgi:hypothetical protein
MAQLSLLVKKCRRQVRLLKYTKAARLPEGAVEDGIKGGFLFF